MIEELGVAGPGSLGSKVFGRFDESGAEELLPESVDGDAGGEGILLINEPVGEVHAGGDGVFFLKRREEVRSVTADFVAKLIVVSTQANVGRVDILAFTHHHGGADGVEVVVLFLLKLFDLFGFGGVSLGDLDLVIEAFEGVCFVRGGEVNVGRLKAANEIGTAAASGFGVAVEVVEEGIHLKEVLLGNGIVFMIVADGALEGEAHEGGADGGDAVDDVLEVGFFREGGAPVDDEVEAVEAGGDELFPGGVFVEVACDLELGELVVGEVLVEGLDDPVAVGRVVAEVVVVVSVGVGDADEVEPVFGHVFAIGGLGDEVVDEPGVGVGRSVVEEVVDFFESGREAGEVEGETANEGAFVGLFLGRFPGGFHFGEGEIVDVAHGPRSVFNSWRGLFFGGNEGPEGFVFSAFFDPLFDEGFFAFGEGLGVAVFGRHGVVFVGDADPGFRVFERVGFDGLEAVFVDLVGPFGDVEAESGFAVGFALFIHAVIGAVAHDALGREDGADILVEGNFSLRQKGEGKAGNGGAFEHCEKEVGDRIRAAWVRLILL